MKHRIHRKIILIASVCCLLGSGRLAAETVVIEQDSQGNYIIDSETKLAQLALNVNDGISYSGETIILTHDIELSTVEHPKTNHTPIGMYGKPFLGTFDGQGHQIMNLQVNSDYYAGLFGYIGTGGVVNYPNEAMTIGSCRAYFKLNGTSKARFCILNLGDSETTSIHERPFTQRDDEADTWFTLDGRRLSGKPKQCGVYINNGRKVVVK